MSNPTNRNLSAALSRDLGQPGSKARIKVLDDSARKVFTANKDGAVWVFPHKQPDPAFWTGIKHYGSGASSRVRARRTPCNVGSVKSETSIADGAKIAVTD